MSTESKAVFLSYASQDAEAAKRICEVLRAAGVEVWFDQNELVGGDAWDAKIRKQIKDCALFVPVISANTQARLEGYFRIEWKLAAQRTHAMAEEKAFLLPVAIDGTRDGEALVPTEFKQVQWSRLPGGEVPLIFVEQVKRLLGPSEKTVAGGAPFDSPQGLSLSNGFPAGADHRGVGAPRPQKVSGSRFVLAAAGAVGLLGVGAAFWYARPPNSNLPSSGAAPAAASAPKGEAEQLAARARAIYTKIVYTREELAMADDLAKRATERDPGSADAWSVRAGIAATFLLRNWDTSSTRLLEAQDFAGRAQGRRPNDAEAYFALGYVMLRQASFDLAAANFRRALEIDPNNGRYARAFGDVAWVRPAYNDEARRVLEAALPRNPSDPFIHYNLARLHRARPEGEFPSDIDWAQSHIDAGLAIQPSGSLYVIKAASLAGWRGDLPGARAALDELAKRPMAEQSDARAVSTAMWIALLERRPDRVTAAAALTAKSYFDDRGGYVDPKDWLLALAHRLDGKERSALQDLDRAENLLKQRLQAAAPADRETAIWELATTLALEGKKDEARNLFAPVEDAWKENTSPGAVPVETAGGGTRQADGAFRERWDLAFYYGAVGDAPSALTYIRRVINYSNSLTARTLALDPWWDKLRGTPEFDAYVKEAEAAARTIEAKEKAETIVK